MNTQFDLTGQVGLVRAQPVDSDTQFRSNWRRRS